MIIRLLRKAFEFLESWSFIQYTSQEEPLVPTDITSQNVTKAMQLLAKAAESENSDAIYLLGELNFVLSLNPSINIH
jgi:hypothetical protein